MKKMLIKIVSLIISCCLVFNIFIIQNNNYILADDVLGSYIQSLIGTSAKEWGGGTGTQCVELPKYYIESYFGIYTKTVGLGNGNEFYKYVASNYPDTFTRIDYYDGFTPQPGDIISFESSTSPAYGHVALVYQVSGNSYTIAEQWKGSGTVNSHNLTIKKGQYGVSYTIIGVARPIATNSCDCSTDYAGDYIVSTESTDLIMRSGHGTNYPVVTTIPKGETVYVSKSNETWAHVDWNGNTGYCSMQYLTKSSGTTECDCSTDYAGDYIVSTESTDLIMRSGHGTEYSVVTTIPKGETVYVSKSNGTWAHVDWNGNTGYCSIQYLTKIADPEPVIVPSKPIGLNISDANSMTKVTLSWGACTDTDWYDLRYYDINGNKISSIWNITDTTYTLTLPAGDYYFNIASVNANGNYTFSNNFNFNISRGDLVPTNVETYNNHIYALYDIMTTYQKANEYAQALGGHLVTITSAEENEFVSNFKNTGCFKTCWLGATDETTEGSWIWSNGEDFSYSNWAEGQPDNCTWNNSNENYLEMWEDGTWNDAINCSAVSSSFIIEIEPLTEQTSQEYNNHTYYVFDDTLTWTEANAYAQNMGGYLVKIDNQEENDFIYSLISNREKTGYWINLDTSNYSNFNDGEPNNTDGIENYYHIDILLVI